MRSHLAVFTLIISISLIPFGARAQWQPDGAPVSTAAFGQDFPKIVSDGAGGAIVAWMDARSGTNEDIYIQRVNASGTPQWTSNGVALCALASSQFDPMIISDGAGGAIVTWYDLRSGAGNDIYAQRVNASGAPQWTANGVALCTKANDQYSPMITSDGAGGAIVTWWDDRIFLNADIYAQRVNAAGAPQWTVDGVALCTAANDQGNPTIVSDGAGGAIVTWYDFRNGNADIFAQRVNASGAPQWTADGVALCTAAGVQEYPTILSNGANGAIVTWTDHRAGGPDVYAQRFNASGTPLWTANGVAVCTAANAQIDPEIASDGAGGAILTWHDARSGTNEDIYAQRVDASGAPRWPLDGVALCALASSQFDPTIVSDGAGGAVVTWYDLRSGVSNDIYAQRVNASGALQWTANGVALCTAAGVRYGPMIISDGAGGAIVTWYDFRSGNYDVYAQRVESEEGFWGHPEPAVTSVADIPSDQGGKVKVNWTASSWDVRHFDTITHYSIWRATETYPLAGAGAQNNVIANPSGIGADFAGPAYWIQKTPTTDYYWEWVGNQGILYSPAYTYSAATRSDSTSQGPADHSFQVVSHTADEFVFWPSNAMSGHSVDNLAPAAPLLLTAQRVGSDVNLKWNRAVAPDLRDYSLYRATSTGVTPVPINFLASSEDTVAVDASAPVSALYYIVTALDVHANQSPPSNEASVGATTNVGNTPPIDALTVLDNMPNPFAGTTTLRIGLPKASEVEIEVFDVAGRSVRSDHTSLLAAGWREISFEARDAAGISLPSGVYFYRVRAAGETLTRKMVIAR